METQDMDIKLIELHEQLGYRNGLRHAFKLVDVAQSQTTDLDFKITLLAMAQLLNEELKKSLELSENISKQVTI